MVSNLKELKFQTHAPRRQEVHLFKLDFPIYLFLCGLNYHTKKCNQLINESQLKLANIEWRLNGEQTRYRQ